MICQGSFTQVIVDVRNKEAFDEYHVISSINIDIHSFYQKFHHTSALPFSEVVLQDKAIISYVSISPKKFFIVGSIELSDLVPFEIEQIFRPIADDERLIILNDSFVNLLTKYRQIICNKASPASNKQNLANLPNEIIPNLFLGGWMGLHNFQMLDEMKIDLVINCAAETNYYEQGSQSRQFIHFQINDVPSQQLPFEKGVEVIEQALSSEKQVLVHCQMGKSRSASIVAAYLIYKFKLTAFEALNIIQTQRPIVRPNDGFLKQLYRWELKTLEENYILEKHSNDKTRKIKMVLNSKIESHVCTRREENSVVFIKFCAIEQYRAQFKIDRQAQLRTKA
ncbi:MAG: putative mitogen-activated protein kinase phosphatase [Streblomastix strix]|uniref:protein-tyrosine-phosphatase n=1 Tax=Streblomastix strix TaxID=222440 RepID=A0A5J4WM35_9EUKA|nr:MAG: putative mitogen-activated protein kinase phosphatase [Streblomastix strix]